MQQMPTDKLIVQNALDTLAKKRAKQEQDDCDFFKKAPSDVREAYYNYWIRSHSAHDEAMPRFLVDHEKDAK